MIHNWVDSVLKKHSYFHVAAFSGDIIFQTHTGDNTKFDENMNAPAEKTWTHCDDGWNTVGMPKQKNATKSDRVVPNYLHTCKNAPGYLLARNGTDG